MEITNLVSGELDARPLSGDDRRPTPAKIVVSDRQVFETLHVPVRMQRCPHRPHHVHKRVMEPEDRVERTAFIHSFSVAQDNKDGFRTLF